MNYRYAAVAAAILLLPVLSVNAYAQDRPALTLDTAIAEALSNSPAVAGSVAREKAADAERDQAGLLPNPEVAITAENAFGGGAYSGLDNAEITYGLSQLVELPGKRGNRVSMATSEQAAMQQQARAARMDVIQAVHVAYAEASIAEAMTAVALEEQSLAKEVHDSVSAKVEAGKEPPLQAQKARITYTSSELAVERSQRRLKAAMGQLQRLLGREKEGFALDASFTSQLETPLPEAEYEKHLNETPEILAAAANIARAGAEVGFEKARRIPDPTINLGLRDFRGSGDQAIVLGVSLPIPVFDRNTASVEKAGGLLNSAKQDAKALEHTKRVELAQAYASLIDAYHTATMLDRDVLPTATEAASIARQSYTAGKLGYLEVLDAQRTLFESQKERLAALLDYHRQKAAIERLTGFNQKNSHSEDAVK